MINKKALTIFLALTFGITIVLALIARAIGFTLVGTPIFMSQMVVLLAMFVPGLSAIITQKLFVKKPLKELGFKWGPWSMYIKTYCVIVLMYIINYAITWAFITEPDFTLISFMNQFAIDPSTLPMSASMMILMLSITTFFIAPIMNMIPSLGEEIGWRGFLLPNLEPLGKVRAIVISGMIWALWHTPLILILGFMYGTEIWPGILLHFLMVTGLGIWMGYIYLKTRSAILAGFMHAVFNANAYGVWAIIFVSNSKLVIGAAGIIGASLCLVLGLITIYVINSEKNIGNRD